MVSGAPPTKVFVRPPLSAVRELTDEEIRAVNLRPPAAADGEPAVFFKSHLSELEQSVLVIAKAYFKEHNAPITVPELGKKLVIRGGSRQRLLEGMKSRGLIRMVQLPGERRGRPPMGIVALI